jgi:uncharacterized lipoprotein YajG
MALVGAGCLVATLTACAARNSTLLACLRLIAEKLAAVLKSDTVCLLTEDGRPTSTIYMPCRGRDSKTVRL